MPRRTRKADHSHGRSEIRERAELQPLIRRAQRGLAVRLRALRTERDLTLEGAAERIGLHANHLERIEATRRGREVNLTLATMVAIAHGYGVPLRSLFDDEPSANGPRAHRRVSE